MVCKWKKKKKDVHQCLKILKIILNKIVSHLFRYSYKKIKKMAGSFKKKLGEGGFK